MNIAINNNMNMYNANRTQVIKDMFLKASKLAAKHFSDYDSRNDNIIASAAAAFHQVGVVDKFDFIVDTVKSHDELANICRFFSGTMDPFEMMELDEKYIPTTIGSLYNYFDGDYETFVNVRKAIKEFLRC